MAKKALVAKDSPKHTARLRKAKKKKRVVRKFKNKIFDDLSAQDKDDLLKAVAVGLGLIKEDP